MVFYSSHHTHCFIPLFFLPWRHGEIVGLVSSIYHLQFHSVSVSIRKHMRYRRPCHSAILFLFSFHKSLSSSSRLQSQNFLSVDYYFACYPPFAFLNRTFISLNMKTIRLTRALIVEYEL